MFVDEAGFHLLPAVVRTYAPSGRTPVLRVPLSWEHLSTISAITPDGRLFIMVGDKAIDGQAIVRFVKHLLRHIQGKLLVIWDGLPAHRGQTVKDFLSNGAAARVHLERLPSYAPDLNPDEGIWRHLKYVELRNVCCHDLSELRIHLRQAVARLRHNPDVILACFHHAGLVVE